jgi:hypothetical protein
MKAKKQAAEPKNMRSKELGYFTFFVCLAPVSIWIASNIISSTQPQSTEVKAHNEVLTTTEEQMPVDIPAILPPELENIVSELPPAAQMPARSQFRPEIIRRLESSSILSSVCSSIAKMDRKQNEPITREQLAKRFEDSVFDRSSDPTFESVKPILKFVLRKPSLRHVLGLKNDINQSTGGVQAAYDEYKALADNQEQLKAILDQSYLLLMLGRSAELKPELASDTDVMRYCQAVEGNLNSLGAVDFTVQKKIFGEFLKAADIEPESIGYEPEYETDLRLEYERNTYSYNVGWIRKLWASN